MNDHSDIQKRLSAYCGNDLTPHECTLVEEHLKVCPECRSELAELQTTMKLLRTTPDIEAPPWLTTRIMAHVHEQQQNRSSWLKRLFFPLHIKLPLEGLAVLFVCVTGFYLSQQVGTELQQNAPHKQRERSTDPTVAPKLQVPEMKSTDKPPLPAMPKEMPAAAVQKTADPLFATPTNKPPVSVTPAVTPAFAPAPSAAKNRSNGSEPYKSAPKAESFDRALESSSYEMTKKAARSAEKQADVSSAAGGTATSTAGAPGGAILPQLIIRVGLATPSQAPEVIRATLIRTGGSIIDEPSPPPGRIRARISVSRLEELYQRLEKIGTIIERPHSVNSPGAAEISIFWQSPQP